MNLRPDNVELLVQIARQNGHEYTDAYAVWRECTPHPDTYLVVDTVLWIAQAQKLPVMEALKLVRGVDEQFGSLAAGDNL
ncbi:hypothetical protein [Spirosoma areae]